MIKRYEKRDIERVREREGEKRDGELEREISIIWRGSINGPFNKGRVGLTLKLDELL